ncbi:MAG: T9SS type A sorting domain-containing protein [Flavobacteriales bacterium]
MKNQLLILFSLFSSALFSQNIAIVNKKFVINGDANCPIYFNGANTPWESWNDFGGSYNQTKWAQNMANLKAKGINSSRIWFSCSGGGQPTIASDGTCTVSQNFLNNCDHLFAQAQSNGIYIMATMMSFDHTKTGNPNATNWQNMLADTSKTRKFIDGFLIPFVNRYKNNPYLWSIDLCNEIEWIYENGGTKGDASNWGGATYAILQRYVAMASEALRSPAAERTDGSHVLITMGSACTKWNGTKMRNGYNGSGWMNNSDGNKWSDAALKAQYNRPNAGLDFYSPHFYGWVDGWYSSPFVKSPTDYGMDEKACMLGEMPSKDPLPSPAMSLTTAFDNLKTLGWQGHMPWTSNLTTNLTNEVGTLADFGTAALAFKNNNSSLVLATCTSSGITEATNSLLFFPNPSNNDFTIKSDGKFTYTISTINGTIMEKGTALNSVITGEMLASGLYLLQITQGNTTTTIKLVKTE